ncbi:hypothetical protein B0H15DRAFT_773720 [Mycena belliarum]|uniref:Uncharacterized protein n=1 Tax=Mycena belliarum TaxID=1033014 RepID=A0AAD6XUQ4_9AGAR|nr:hypothetical protein B0H15DRAFT_773720 [Mycena belliae]
MDRLPPELHDLVLGLACAAPGSHKVPRALSLTSTYFRAIAKPFLFHTIAVSSVAQATIILALLEVAPAHQRSIRRLFIGADLPQLTTFRLMHFAAPTVHDLAIVAESALLSTIFRMLLPQLRALAVRGFYPLPRPGAFPILTHLHVSGRHSPGGLPPALARACPALTHIRVSSLRAAPAFAREMRAALEAEDARPPLASVILEAQPPPDGARLSKVDYARDAEMRDILSGLDTSLRSRGRTNAPCMTFLDRMDDDVEGMKRSWLVLGCP